MLSIDGLRLSEQSEQLQTIANNLSQYSPYAIVIPTSLLQDSNKQTLSKLNSIPKVKIVEKITRRLTQDGQLIFDHEQSNPNDITAYWLPFSLDSGAYRKWFTRIDSKSGQKRSFQSEICQNLGKEKLESETLINFSGGPLAIPRIDQKRVLDNDLVYELVQNRVVILDTTSHLDDARFASPFVNQDFGLSALELQAFAMETCLQEKALKTTPLLIIIILFALIFFISTFIFQFVSATSAMLGSLTSAFIFIFVSVIALYQFKLLLPISQFVASQLAITVIFYQIRRHQENDMLERVLGDLQYSLSKRLSPANFNTTEKPWLKIIALINQQLELNRSILLERVTGDHRVTEIEALNCSVDDIDELRRDYERMPYSAAIENNGVLKLDRPYFNQKAEDEDEYLCVLQFGGQVLGFWALTVVKQEKFNERAFQNNVNSFANQIANLLYHREQWQQAQKTEKSFWSRFANLRLGEQKQSQLKQLVTSLEKRVDTMEHVFDGMTSASILYDLFGQVIQSNALIEELAKTSNIPVYQLTALEFLCRVCDVNADGARRELRHVVTKQQAVSLPTKGLADDVPYILNIRPLKSESSKEGSPFQLLGILFEFVDVSTLKQVLRMKQDIYSQFFHQIRNNLASLNLISRRLKKQKTTDNPAYLDLMKIMSENLTKTHNMLDDVEGFLAKSNEIDRINILPIDPLFTLKQEKNKHIEKLNDKNIDIELDIPNIVSLVFVNPLRFQRLLASCFAILTEDALPNTKLLITLKDKEENQERHIYLMMKNEGYGISPEKLTEAIGHIGIEQGTESALNEFAIQVSFSKFAGIAIDVDTNIGKGFEINIELKGFKLDL